MTTERWQHLMSNDNENLRQDEVDEGWHFCWEFDGLLRNNNEVTFQCTCFSQKASISDEIPCPQNQKET